ncbi:OmpA family protein [Anditalea andensis]|uniref:Membrane protein n=1 Tax=Anditalea andensis TaxID=1048983 RepID=A0A074LKX8_9BACT|nr:OmpA family protein [Anditalea andensis]KEO74497.1 membrane protein [Anditalea andensis]
MKKCHFLILLFIFPFCVQAQEYSIADKKAIRLHEEAEQMVLRRRYDEAINNYKASIDKNKDFLESYIRWAQLLLTKGDALQALAVAERGATRVNNNSQMQGSFGWLITNILMSTGDFNKAIEKFNQSKPYFSPGLKQNNNYIALEQQLDFIQNQLASPISIQKERLPHPLNQFNLQYFPVLTADSRKILFTKRDGLSQQDHEDIFMSYYENGSWSTPEPIAETVNTLYNEGTCTISADGNILIYTSCDAPDSFGSCDLYITYKLNGIWQKPVNMGPSVNSKQWDSQPSLSADGSMLFFSSNRRGGYGGNDIWYTVRQKNNAWAEAKNLGPAVNTPKDEVSPFIYFNNELLFFASNGHIGFGGMDLYMSKMEEGDFGRPENMGYPINDHKDQLALFITAQRDYAYYTENSFTDGKLEGSYLYRFAFPEEVDLGEKIIVTEGRVLNSRTGLPVSAKLSLVSLENDSTLYEFRSDGETGDFMMLYPDQSFSGLYVEKEGFLPKIYNVEKDSLKNKKNMEISLTPIAPGEQFIFENVFFDFDKADLKSESMSSLRRLHEFLTSNPKVSITIVGHTDNVGASQYNQKLSHRRADAVKTYLLENGVSEDRLGIEGMGDKHPIAPHHTPETRALNRRIEVVIR